MYLCTSNRIDKKNILIPTKQFCLNEPNLFEQLIDNQFPSLKSSYKTLTASVPTSPPVQKTKRKKKKKN